MRIYLKETFLNKGPIVPFDGFQGFPYKTPIFVGGFCTELNVFEGGLGGTFYKKFPPGISSSAGRVRVFGAQVTNF